jgi:outer membrane protein W
MKRILAVVVMMCALPLVAQSNDIGVWISTQVNDHGGPVPASAALESRFDNGSGYGASFSHVFAPNVSGDLAVFKTSAAARLVSGSETASLGDVKLTPITLMVRYDFMPERTVGVYVGAGIAHVLTDKLDSNDLRTNGLGPVALDDETTWTIGGVMTVRVAPRIALALDARYIPMKLSGHAAGENRISTDFNPLLISAGVKFRW